ncbi:MAG: cupredoxin family copper-binding protein [Patescibacteria group bacterium]
MKKILLGILTILVVVGIYHFINHTQVGQRMTVNVPGKSTAEMKVKDPLTVEISDYTFLPSPLKIKVGQTVTWVNRDIAKHTVTDNNGGFESSYFGKGESYTYTFTETGTFDYHCAPHPYMKGTIEVTN